MVEAGSSGVEEPSRYRDGVVVHEVPEQERHLNEFWTEDRMRNAEPL